MELERVVVSQLIRSPGAFFTARLWRGKNYFGSKIIPNRGAWLEFETEESGLLELRLIEREKFQQQHCLWLWVWHNIAKVEKAFADVDTGEIRYIKETLRRDTCKDQKEALVEVYRRLDREIWLLQIRPGFDF